MSVAEPETPRVAHRVATYNVHSCIGIDRRRSPERIAEVICELEADTIALQEVDTHHHRGEVYSQLEWLAKHTGLTPVAGPTLSGRHGPFGNALLTRRTPLSVRRHDLSVGDFEPRGALEMEIEVDGTSVHVLATHLGLAGRERHRQVDALVARLADLRQCPRAARDGIDRMEDESGPPVVLLGDFNEWWPRSALSRRLRTLGMTPHPRSYPSPFPLLSLDRICGLPSGLLASAPRTHASRLSRIASDHLPVVADLRRCSVSNKT